MLYTYHSNRLETLAVELAHAVATPLPSAFQTETVVVQNGGMGRWLSLRIADELGICANLAFQMPGEFVWSAVREIVSDVPKTSPFEPEILTWRIFSALLDPNTTQLFPEVAHFLADGDELKHFEFARQIARTFDQYLVYRPDWIRDWDTGYDEGWQPRLWRWLNASMPRHGVLHWVGLQQRVYAQLSESNPPRLSLPRVSLFAISTLSPSYLQFITAVASVMDVHMFILNPSAAYWADIRSRREIARAARSGESATTYLEEGNSLLASLGRQGRDYIDSLVAIAEQVERDCFVDLEGQSLLEKIQNDILQLRNPTTRLNGDADGVSGIIQSNDQSIAVHVCHSPLREIEVLHDQLLALFDEQGRDDSHGKTRPEDVLVMTPDVSVYAPFIEAVFGAGLGTVRIPYSIADRALTEENPDVEAFFDLLALIDKRFDAASIGSLLDVPAIRRRLRFSDEDVDAIHHFIREAGIRWGIDALAKTDWGVPSTPQHTWQFGLDRLLLGYAMPGHNEFMVQGILPYDPVEGSRALVLGKFYSFVRDLEAWVVEARRPQSHDYWAARLEQLLERFFEIETGEEAPWRPLREAIRALPDRCRQADYFSPITHRIVVAFLRDEIQQRSRNPGFLRRGVTFCATLPMRNIPHAVICLIGMNDGAFPRMTRPASFDLMPADPRRGDRSARDDDRYLFLEVILAARKKLYISYVGQSQKDNSRIPPSVVVSELLDYIEQGYRLNAAGDTASGIGTRQITTLHPLQAFGRAYFDPRGNPQLFTYNPRLERASRVINKSDQMEPPFFISSLTVADESWRVIDLPSLYAFFRNPARYLLRQRLRLHLPENEAMLETLEPFTLEWGVARHVRDALLESVVKAEQIDQLRERLRARGLLPHGVVGDVLLDEEFGRVMGLRERIVELNAGDPLAPRPFDLEIGSFRLSGELDHVYACGRVVIDAVRAGPSHRLRLWLGHLVGHCIDEHHVPGASYLLAVEGSAVLRPVNEARSLLLDLLELYWQGINAALHFYPRTSFDYTQRWVRDDPDGARTKARQTWEGNDFATGENSDPYIALALRGQDPLDDIFEMIARRVYEPLIASMEPL